MQTRLGQAILAVLIIGGAGAVVYTVTRGSSGVTAEDDIAPPTRPTADSGPSGGIQLVPPVNRDELDAAIAVLCGPIDIEALEKECDRLVEKLDPHQKLTAPDDIRTLHDLHVEALSWRHMVREYDETTKDPPAIKTEAGELILRLERQAAKLEPIQDRSKILARLDELYEAGTRDAVIRWCSLSYAPVTDGPAYVEFIASLPDLNQSNRFKFDVSSSYLRKFPTARGNTPEMYQYYARLLTNELSAFNPQTDNIREVFESYLSSHLVMSKALRHWVLTEWAKDKPDIHPVFMYFLAGDSAAAMGWMARGNGYAGSIDEDNWEVFREEFEDARQYFLKAWSLFPDLPYASGRLIAVTRSGSQARRSPRDWFNITTSIRFDYGTAYSLYTPSLQPRWGGSDEAMFAFVRECFDADAPRTHIPYTAIEQLKWWLEMEQAVDRDFLPYSLELTDLANDVTQHLVAWKKQHGQDKTLVLKDVREWSMSLLIRNRMFLEAAPLTLNLSESVNLTQVSKSGDPMFCLLAARAMSEENGSELDDLEQRFTEPFPEFSLSEVETWKEEMQKRVGTMEAAYLETRYEFMRVRAELASGKQVQLYCDARPRCWVSERCELSATGHDSFLVSPIRQRGRWRLASRIPFRAPYTLKASIERTGEPDDLVSIVLARRPYDPAELPAKPQKFIREAMFDLPEGKKLDLEVRVTPDTAVCLVNGEPVPGEIERMSDSLTLWFEAQSSLRIGNITVKSESGE